MSIYLKIISKLVQKLGHDIIVVQADQMFYNNFENQRFHLVLEHPMQQTLSPTRPTVLPTSFI